MGWGACLRSASEEVSGDVSGSYFSQGIFAGSERHHPSGGSEALPRGRDASLLLHLGAQWLPDHGVSLFSAALLLRNWPYQRMLNLFPRNNNVVTPVMHEARRLRVRILSLIRLIRL